MGKFVVGIVGLVIGLGLGLIGGATLGFGGGAGVGIATGFSAGACGVVRAAQDEGLLDAAQVDQVFSRAVEIFREMGDGSGSGETIVGSAAQCDAALDALAAAAQ